MIEVIHTDSLTKSFGKNLAVDDVSLCVYAGEIYGFLGLNGAGKTTTIRALLGMIKPTGGSISLFGKKLRFGGSMNIWSNIGYMVELPVCYPNLTTRENVLIHWRYRRIANLAMVDEILDRLQLSQFANKRASHLSQGNLQRLGLAKAMVHKPELLILDEPTNGLDPAGIVEMRNMFRELTISGTTLFISSHILSEVAQLASRIGIIHQGKLVTELNSHELDGQLARRFVVDTGNNQGALEFLKSRDIKAAIAENGRIAIVDRSAFENPEGVSALLVNAGYAPKEMFQDIESLETFFMRTIIASSHEKTV